MRRGLFTREALARRLLIWAAAMCGFLFSACVIPTPLEQAPQEVNYAPVLVPDTAQPPFGPLILSSSSTVQIMLQADDPNLDDTLLLRLFKLGSTGPLSRVFITDAPSPMQPLAVPDPQHPTRRLGGFQSLNFCALFGSTTLFVEVADRPFSNTPGQEAEVPGGLYDEKSWDVRCQ